jgi:hypothetical protein
MILQAAEQRIAQIKPEDQIIPSLKPEMIQDNVR